MYRAAASRLRTPLKGQGGNRSLTRFASSSAVAAKSSSGGIFSWFTGGSSPTLPPLDFPLKGIEFPPPLPDTIETADTKITTLPNGLRIASESSSSPAAFIGLYIDSGSIYETPLSLGATHILEHMAFKTTANRSHLRLVREVEAIGGNVMVSRERDYMSYTFDALKTYVPQMVELLVDAVRNQVFLDWEVKEQIAKVKAEMSEYANNPETLLLEAIHSAGYNGALANPLLASEDSLDRLDSTILEQFVAENYTAPRIVLAASGVEHEELLKYAEPLLSDMPRGGQVEEPSSLYVGGDYRVGADTGMTSFALAYGLPSGWLDAKAAMTLTVIQMLMGGGGSFSAGGPGKGMYSRLYVGILNDHPEVQSCTAFNSIYNNTSIFGIQCTTSPDFACKALNKVATELRALATDHVITIRREELERAKEATKSALLMNLESRMITSGDIGRQLLTYGERRPVEYFLKAVDEVTGEKVKAMMEKLISSPLTMATHGDLREVPSYRRVSKAVSEGDYLYMST